MKGRGDGETGGRGEAEIRHGAPDVPLLAPSPRLPVSPSPLHSLKEGEDFYREGAAVVFTASYHLRRGYCCENGCRHCPFRVAADAKAKANDEKNRERVE